VVAAPVTVLGLALALFVSPVATGEAQAETPANAVVFHKLHFNMTQSTSFRARAARTALMQRSKPYRYGAAGPGSFDCSGLTSYAYRQAGKLLPRTSTSQRGATAAVSRGEMQPGDLLFYGGHVAMFVGRSGGRDWMVEAPNSGKTVRVVVLRERGLLKIGRVRA
jgi:cell wall-associated NlpC family hydrolase